MTLPRTKSWSGPNHTGQVQVNLVENLGRRILTVSRVETLSPNFIRVYLTGDDLAEGFPYMHLAATDHVKVLFPQPGTNEVVIPTRGPKGWVTEEGAPEPIRDYFRLELGLPRERVSVDGYWKRGLANLDHHSIKFED